MSASSDVPPVEDYTVDYPGEELLIASVLFAAVGAVLALLVSLALRRAVPRLARVSFIVIASVSVPALIIPMIGLIGLAIEGQFSLSFLLTMRREGWAMLAAATVAGMLVARHLAPARPLKVDPSVFE